MPKAGHLTPSSFPALMTGVSFEPSVAELRAILDDLGIVYKKNMLKAELSALVPYDYIMPVNMSWPQTAKNVVCEYVIERLGGVIRNRDVSTPSTTWGINNEPVATRAYEEKFLVEVIKPQARLHPSLPFVCGQMDGLVIGTRGGVETKCPYNPVNHLMNIIDAAQVDQYFAQMQGYMSIYELDWIDFLSFDPEMPEEGQLFCKRILRDDKYISILHKRLVQAHELAEEMIGEYMIEMGG